MRVLVAFLLVAVIYSPSSYKAGAAVVRCMNQPKSVEEAVKRSTAIFSGEVINVDASGTIIEARFRVEQSWKGLGDDEISVSASRTVESPRYQVGEKYLVYADKWQGKLFTGNCSRTKKIERATDDLQQLGAGKVVNVNAK